MSSEVRLGNVRDHPRVCGEKVVALGVALFAKGSPPRMWGKELPAINIYQLAGITPAYAGKSLLPAAIGRLSMGSPPRMRGKAFLQNLQV